MKKTKKKETITVAVLIAASNEDRVIVKTLKALLKIVPAKDLYVVDDGSKDKTSELAKRYTKNVLRKEHHGKAIALNAGLKHFNLTDKYGYILFMDADSWPTTDFLDSAIVHFKKDPKKEIVCVSGRIKGIGQDWISKYRQWEYQISFSIHKKAQAYLSSILVTPGCATIYRSSVFKTLKFPTGTLTEDMDFTFQMHRVGYNKMVFEDKAIVYTVDPATIKDFIKQITRWYTGFWQVVRKHDIPWQGQMLDLEVAMLAIEGLYNGLLVGFFFLSLVSHALFGGLNILIIPFLFDLLLFFIPSLIWSSVSDKEYSRLLFIPHFYFLRFLSSFIFIKSYFTGFLSPEKEYVWNTNRYTGKEVF